MYLSGEEIGLSGAVLVEIKNMEERLEILVSDILCLGIKHKSNTYL